MDLCLITLITQLLHHDLFIIAYVNNSVYCKINGCKVSKHSTPNVATACKVKESK